MTSLNLGLPAEPIGRERHLQVCRGPLTEREKSILAKYDISENGFLPAKEPLQTLPAYYTPWEDVVKKLRALLLADRLRIKVDSLPILSTSTLSEEAEWKRAYVLLAFISHAYIWGGSHPAQKLPPSISIPFLAVSRKLKLPPVATYAALNLWNWHRLKPDADIGIPENLAILHTFTGTKDEAWFYLISVAMEARAAPIIPIMLEAIHAAEEDNTAIVVKTLKDLSAHLEEIGALLERMDEQCDPHVFYHRVRPYLAGSRNMEAAGLPNGVFYDEGDGRGEWKQYRGGSNAQSSLIQFCDIVLGVKHHTPNEICFHEEMRSYMPASHAAFLKHVTSTTNIYTYVRRNRSNRKLLGAFNTAITSLGSFRDKHIQLVTRYIIIPSNTPVQPQHIQRLNLAVVSSMNREMRGSKDSRELCGTGGTKLIPFLKRTRDETNEAAISGRRVAT